VDYPRQQETSTKGPSLPVQLLWNALALLHHKCLTFLFRRAEITNGQCKIGLRLPGNIPLLIFDICINVYLTTLFLQPLKQMSAFNGAKGRLRTMTRRTFIGSASTLLLTMANLVALLVAKGREPGWICLACCNGDVLFSALVLHWVTHVDDDTTSMVTVCKGCQGKMSKFDVHSHTQSQSRNIDFSRGVGYGNGVTTDITAGKKQNKREKLEADAIPMGKIGYKVETTQDRQDVESVETDDHDYPAKANSTDQIHSSAA